MTGLIAGAAAAAAGARRWAQRHRRTLATWLRVRSPTSPGGRQLTPDERADLREALAADQIDPGGTDTDEE